MNDAQQAIAQCEALRSLLTQYQNKQQIPQAKTLTKDLPRRKAMLELEGHITQVYEQLSHIFDATLIPRPSDAGKEDRPGDTAAPSLAKDLASPSSVHSAVSRAFSGAISNRHNTG